MLGKCCTTQGEWMKGKKSQHGYTVHLKGFDLLMVEQTYHAILLLLYWGNVLQYCTVKAL